MKQFKSVLFVVFLLSFFALTSNAQKGNIRRRFIKYRYYSIGASVNLMNYVGDLDPGPSLVNPSIKFTRYNFGLTGLYRIKPRVSLRGTFSYGRIKGDDSKSANYDEINVYRLYRNLSFRNQIYEFKADVVFDLLKNSRRFTKRPDFTPYMFVGLAYFHHNPQAQNANGDWVNLKELHTEGQGLPGGPKNYSLNQLAIPLGVGLRYKLSKQWDLAFEIGWRFTLTDYLDDVAGTYYNKQALTDAYGDESRIMSDKSYQAYSTNPDLATSADSHFGTTPETYYPGQTQNKNDGWTGISTYGQQGGQRGDLKGRRDVYIITGFHLTYIFPGKIVCPKFR